jgi:alginate O-acetyltransferase complex protein AlgJ
MTKFLSKITIFSIIPLIFLFIIEGILPPTLFTFRAWEAIKAKTPLFVGPFYPNVEYDMIEEGDLAHHTNYAIEKNVSWKTDKLGYRNNHFNSSADILLIGDSNIAGSSLSQQEILASVLKEYTGLFVYNLAPANVNTFIRLKNEGIFQPPRIVILSSIERNIPSFPPVNALLKFNHPVQVQFNSVVSFFAMQFDKLIRANSIEYFKSRIKGSVGGGIQSAIDKKMFFLQGRKAVIKTSDNSIDPIVKRIKNYKNYFNSIGSEFIFLPIPNKETILWKLAGLKKQPTFITQLNNKLGINEIITIDTIKLFNDLLESEILPYHYDDSHWNKYANDEVAKTITKYFKLTKIVTMNKSP